MNEVIYLEPDDDIASVIGRIKEIDADGVSLMVPRGGTIAQSVVNLKLIKREIENQNKIISLVTNDKISRNLASQVGVTVYSSVSEAKAAKPVRPKQIEMEEIGGDEVIEAATPEEIAASGFTVNRYDKESEEAPLESPAAEDAAKEELPSAEPEEEIIMPEAKEQKPEPKEASEPIVISNSSSSERPPEKKPEIAPAFQPKAGPKKIGSRKKPLIIIVSSFLVVALVLSYLFLPHATAMVTLASDDFAKKYEFTVDKAATEVNANDAILPAEEKSTQGELSKEYDATGSKDAGTKAGGEIVFYNAYSSTDQQTVPDGSVVSSQGLQFVVNGAVTIPVATTALINGKQVITPGQAKGKIIAQNAGAQYNLTPSKYTIESFSGDKRMNIYGQTTAALSGGTTKTVKIVSADDIKKAKDALGSELTTQLSDTIQAELTKASNKFLNSTVAGEEISFEPSAKEGDEAEKFTAKLALKITGLSFSESALRNLIVDKVDKEIGENKMIINPNDAALTYDVVSYDKEKLLVKMTADFSGKIGHKIDTASVRNNIKYKKYGSAKDYLSNLEGVQDVDLRVWPSVFARTPILASRITINFGYAE